MLFCITPLPLLLWLIGHLWCPQAFATNIITGTTYSQNGTPVYQVIHPQCLIEHTYVVTGWLYVRYHNRLGNNLFQITSTYAIAKKTKKIPGLSKPFLMYFDIGEPGQDIAEITEIGHYWTLLVTLGLGNYQVCCYMQSWKYLDEVFGWIQWRYKGHVSVWIFINQNGRQVFAIT